MIFAFVGNDADEAEAVDVPATHVLALLKKVDCLEEAEQLASSDFDDWHVVDIDQLLPEFEQDCLLDLYPGVGGGGFYCFHFIFLLSLLFAELEYGVYHEKHLVKWEEVSLVYH